MTEPLCPQKAPFIVPEEPGRRAWCACGRSANQPYCDGSHKGTGLSPTKVEIEAPRTVAWCGCKRTGTPPFCDGTHATL